MFLSIFILAFSAAAAAYWTNYVVAAILASCRARKLSGQPG